MAVKFMPNRAVRVKFKYANGKEVENKFKPGEMQMMYGVITNDGEDYLYASDYLKDQIEKFQPLKDKNLFIEKVVDETQKVRWNVTTDGAPAFELKTSALDGPVKETSVELVSLEQKVGECLVLLKTIHAKLELGQKSDVPWE